MDDALRLRALAAVSVDVGHHVMAHFLLPGLRHIIIDIVLMAFQLVNLLLGDGQSQLLLCLSQSNPQLSPGPEFFVRREDILHLPAGVTLRKRAYISVCTHIFSFIHTFPAPGSPGAALRETRRASPVRKLTGPGG